MRRIRSIEIGALTADIRTELAKMQQLKAQIQRVQTELETYPDRADLLYENFALKLHNFYRGLDSYLAPERVPLGRGLQRRETPFFRTQGATAISPQ